MPLLYRLAAVTVALALPLYLLFEVSVIVAYIIEKRRRKAKERDAEDGVAAE